ncbi:MAG: fibronectin type III domain-containing protein [Candidatus Berkelbacteria bacterium]|nr:fibronectin type III domain-containing protein [Candidatus Berkelbacteria bacterium]
MKTIKQQSGTKTRRRPLTLILAALLVLAGIGATLFFISRQPARALGITKYARTAGGNWSADATWSTTSGGAADTTAPTANDDVVFDANSGDVTIDAAAVAGSVDASAYDAARTLTHNADITLSIGDAESGALNFSGSWTYTKGSATTSAISFISTSNNGGAGWNITWGGHTPGNVTFDGTGGEWVLQDGYTATSTTLYLKAGELNTNGQTISFGTFTPTNSASAILTLGASSITVGRWNNNQVASWVLNCGTSTVTVTYNAFNPGSKTYYSVVLSGEDILMIGSGTYTNFTRTGTATKNNVLTLHNVGQTITGTLTLTGNSAANRLLVKSGTFGATRTFTAAAVDIDNVDFQDIAGAGAASPFTGVSIGDAGGNSGITPTSAQTNYWVGNGGDWSDAANHWANASGGGAGTGRAPLPQDTARFDANSFSSASQTVTTDMPRIGTVDWTGATNTPTWALTSTTYYTFGSVTLISGMTYSNSNDIYFQGRSSYALTSAGKTLLGAGAYMYIHMVGGTLTLQDDLTLSSSSSLYIRYGTFDANDHNVTVGGNAGVYSSYSDTRSILMGSGTWNMIGYGGWDIATTTGLTFDAETSNLTLSTYNGTRKFTGGGLTYYNVSLNTGSFSFNPISGDNTFNNFTLANIDQTVSFTAGSIQTINGTFSATGTSGNLITINSYTPGSPFTLSKSSGIATIDYVSLQDSTATGGAGWNAKRSTNVSGNSGWNFVKTAVAAGGNWSAGATWFNGVAPTATDNVFLDAVSGNVTVDTVSCVAKTLDLTGYTNTLTFGASNTLTVSGNVTLATGRVTANSGSTLAINATGTLISAGNTLYNLTISSGGSVTLGDNSNFSNQVTLSGGGTLITDGGAGSLTHNWSILYSNYTVARTLTLGNSTINVSATSGTSWAMQNTTNLTLNADTSTINITGASSMIVANGGGIGKIFNIVNFTGSGTPVLNAVTSTFATLTRTGTAVKTDGFTINTNFTVTGILSLAGNSATNRLLVQSITLGTPSTIIITGATYTGTNNVDFQDITFADNKVGNTDLTNGGLNSIGDCGGNSRTLGTGNLVMTTPATQTWSGSSGGNWSANAWSGRVPLPQDDVSFNGVNFSSGQTVTADMPRLGKSISWVGATYTAPTKPTWAVTLATGNTIYGSLTLISSTTGMTLVYNQYLTFRGRGSYTLTSAGNAFNSNTTFSMVNGTLTLLDNFSSNASTSHSAGTFNANGYNVTVYSWSSGSATTLNMGSNSTWKMTTGGWNATGTVNTSTSTIWIAGTGATASPFSGGTATYNNITISPGSGITTFSGAFTFANMTMASAGTKTVKFTKSTTYTMTGSSFLNGTSGNLITIDSDDGATPFTMTKPSGAVVVDYVAKSRMAVTGGATWYSTANSTPYPDPNINGNSGWSASGSGNIRTVSAAGGNWTAAGAWNEGSAPTSSDDVFALSGSGNVTVDTTGCVAKTLTMAGYTNILTLGTNNTLTVSGGVTFVAGKVTANASSGLYINATGTLISAGNTLWNVATSVGTVTLGDGLTISGQFTHSSGTLITDGGAGSLTHSWVIFASSNSNVRTISLGNSTINLTGTGTGTWTTSNSTNLTLNAGTSTINFTGNTAGSTLMYDGGKTFNNVNFTGSGSPNLYANGSTFANLTRTGTAVKTDGFSFSTNFAVTGTLSLAGNSAINRLLVKSDTLGTARTITTTGATVTTNNVDFMDITFANGGSDLDLTNGGANSIGDCGGNSISGGGTLTMTTPVAQTWNDATGGNWSDAGNWTSRVPLPQDNVSMAVAGGYNSGVTVTADMPRLGKSIDWTGAGYTGTKPTWALNTLSAYYSYGSFTLISGMTFTVGGYYYPIYFQGRGSYTLTTAGNNFYTNLYVEMPTGTLTLQDALSVTYMLTVKNGTFNANNYNVSTAGLSSNVTTTRAITMGSGTWTITGVSSSYLWYVRTDSLTLDCGTSTIALTKTDSATSSFYGGGQIYNNITISPSATNVLTFFNAFTFANMTMASAGTKTVKFTKDTTYTMTGTNFLNGTAGNLVTIDSDDGVTQWTLLKASGMVVCDYVSMNRSNATGGATFYLTANSSGTGNTGWITDNTPPTNPTTFNGYSDSGKGTPITTDNFYNYPTPYFEWDGATDSQSGVAGYWVYFGTDDTADPLTAGTFQTGVSYTASALSTSDTYYFRLRTKDNALNLSAAQTYFTYKFDSVNPEPPSFIAASPSGYTGINSFSFSWPAATDPSPEQSGIAGYQYKRGNGVDDWSATQVERTVTGITAYQEGTNAFLVRSVDTAGNFSADVQTSYYYTTSAPAKPTSLIADPPSSSTNSFTFTWNAPSHPTNIVNYGWSVNAWPSMSNVTWTGSSSTTLTAGAYATTQGNNTFYLVARDEAGNYAFDEANVATVNFTCSTTAPPTPTGVTISDTSNRAASIWELTIKWTAGAGQDPASFDHYQVERSTNGINFQVAGTTANTVYLDSGLSSSTTYYYRIKSVDNAGNASTPSSVVSKQPTGNYTSPPVLVGMPSVSAQATTATVNWVTSRASNSFVRYSTNESDLASSTDNKGQIETVIEHSVGLSGLSSSTTYYYQVLSYDENREYSLTLAYSGVYSFTTTPAPAVSNVSVSNVKLTTADISYETSNPATTSLRYGTSVSYGSTLEEAASSKTTKHSVTLDNLTHSTVYHFKIYGTDTDSNEFSSDDYVFETLPEPRIYGISYYKDTSGPYPAIVIVWKSNVPISTSIEYRPKDGLPILEQSKSAMTQDHKATLTELKDNTEYTFYTFGRDQFGNQARSDTHTLFTDLDARAPEISDITIESSNVGEGTVDKARIVVSFKTDEPTTNQVEYGEGLGADEFPYKTTENTALSQNHVVVISDLKPSTPYTLRILVKDKAYNLTTSKSFVAVPGEPSMSVLTIMLNTLTKLFGWMIGLF